ncbi:MAG: S-layer homology domain-containing protein [Synergistetes bacterium]|nr:S-layer homology domain-containing protein [Synergistota bacterium]MDW8191612.1 S-layer homology domain-containing protein [Synergistota bacterium]
MRRLIPIMLILSLFLIVTPLYASNPFVDVPLNHWAYDALKKLSAAGIVVGYPDGTFQGTKPITRYEIAMVIARALAKVDETKASKEDLALLKKLIVEFKDELNALGVKLDKIDKRLATVEKNLNNFAFSGSLELYFYWNSGDYFNLTKDYQTAQFDEIYLYASKQVDDKVSVTFRFEGETGRVVVGRAYADIALPWNINMTIGKWVLDWEGERGLYSDNDAILTDRVYAPIIYFNKKSGSVDIALYYAYSDGDEVAEYGGRLDFFMGEKFRLGLFYMGWKTAPGITLDPYAYGVDFTFNLTEGFKLYGQYISEDLGGRVDVAGVYVDKPIIYKLGLSLDQSLLKFTSLTAEYMHMDRGAFYTDRTSQPYSYLEAQGFLIDTSEINGVSSPVLSGYVADDVNVFFLKLTQQWSDKVSTTQRYYNVNYKGENLPDATSFSLSFLYQYTPSLSFEFGFQRVNWTSGFDIRQNESRFSFTTYITF